MLVFNLYNITVPTSENQKYFHHTLQFTNHFYKMIVLGQIRKIIFNINKP